MSRVFSGFRGLFGSEPREVGPSLMTLGPSSIGSKIHVRLPGKANSSSHGARPVHQIISMLKCIRTSRLSINNSLSLRIYPRGVGGFGLQVLRDAHVLQ